VALVIAHEIAHQWFGNLVTMEWWTHLWLNEGFASYIEYLAVDKLFPSWNIWTQFAYLDMSTALSLDALKHTHPIEIPVHHPSEIAEIFDEVSYSKGASVIRMLADYLGEKDFRDGLRHYLKKHAYSNTHTTDLWASFEKISKKPVTKIMQNWT
jgi:puromycin-sensitive aminopeptidase